MTYAARPTYRTGFARGPGDARYPSLWDNLLFAWQPSLGPSGSLIYDWGPTRNHGTISSTNTPNWIRDPKGHAFSHFLTNDVGAGSATFAADTFAISAWVRRPDWTTAALKPLFLWNNGATSGIALFVIWQNFADAGDHAIVLYGNGYNSGQTPRAITAAGTTAAFTNNDYKHIYGCIGPRNAELWIGGSPATMDADTAVGSVAAISSAQPIYFTNPGSGASNNTWHGITVWTTPRTRAEITLLASAPDVLFQKRRKAAKVPGASGNRRRRVLICGSTG